MNAIGLRPEFREIPQKPGPNGPETDPRVSLGQAERVVLLPEYILRPRARINGPKWRPVAEVKNLLKTSGSALNE